MNGQVPSLQNRVDSKKPFSFWAFIIIILFFIGILLLLFLRSPFSTINTIEIKGNHLVSTESIVDHIPISKGISFFSVNTSQVRKSIVSFPEIKDVEVTRGFPNTIYITITEKKIIGLIRSNYHLYPVFEDGQVIKKNYFDLDLYDKPILEGWKFPNTTIQLACTNLSHLPRRILSQILRIKPVLNEPEQVEILTRKHHQIFVRSTELSKKLRIYLSFLDHPPGKLYLLESVWFKPEKYSS